jgi:hypothetical protein
MKPAWMNQNEFSTRIALLLIAACVLLSTFASPNALGADEKKMELGFVGCKAAVFLKPQAGLVVSFSELTYDSFGYPKSFVARIQYPGSKLTLAQVNVDNSTWHGDCGTLRYKAVVNGVTVQSPTVQEFRKRVMHGYVALSFEGAGGLWSVPSAETEKTEIQTELSYDSFGRRQVSRQIFKCQGVSHEIGFSDYSRDDFGRLSSYVANFNK